MEKPHQQKIHTQFSSGTQASIKSKTSTVQRLVKIPNTGPQETRGSYRRCCSKVVGQRSNRNSTEHCRFLQPIFCGTQENARVEARAQSKEVQSLYERHKVQTSNHQRCQESHSAVRLGFFHRSLRRVHACTSVFRAQTVHAVCVEGNTVPIPSNSVRSLYGAQNLDNIDKTCHSSDKDKRLENNNFLGRHVMSREVKASGQNCKKVHSWSSEISWIQSKLRKVNAEGSTGVHLRGHSMEYKNNDNVNGNGQIAENQGDGTGHAGKCSNMQENHEIHGFSEFSSLRPPGGQEESKSHPKMLTGQLQQRQGLVQESASHTRSSESAEVLDTGETRTCANKTSNAPDSVGNRQYTPKLGVYHPRRGCSQTGICWRLVPESHGRTHQLQGTAVRSESTQNEPGRDPGQSYHSADRQHDSTGLSDKSRWHQVPQHVKFSMRDPRVNRQPGSRAGSILHFNHREPRGGLQVQENRDSNMDTVGQSVSENTVQIQSRDRPVCMQIGLQAPPVFYYRQEGQDGSRPGCIHPEMEFPDTLRISPAGFGSSDPQQVSTEGGKKRPGGAQTNVAGSTVLASAPVAPSSAQHAGRSAKTPKVQKRLGGFHGSRSQSSKVDQAAADPVDITRRVLRKQGFSAKVCERVALSTRKSTRTTYRQCWKEWIKFCQQHSLGFLTLYVNKLAKFVNFLFDKGWAWQTVKVHRSAICSILQPHKDKTAGSHTIIRKLMRHMFLERPPSRKVYTPWDVQILLEFLASWSPASTLTLKQLSFKTACLVALATAKRCADLALLHVSSSHMLLGKKNITFFPTFGSKTDRESHFLAPVKIEPYNEDRRLCPVFYLKLYLKKTAQFRNRPNTAGLFLSLNKYHIPVSGQTISRWVRDTIGQAGAHMSPGSLRSASVSIALTQGVALNLVIQAGDWSNTTTPNRHYFQVLVSQEQARHDAVQRAVLGFNSQGGGVAEDQ